MPRFADPTTSPAVSKRQCINLMRDKTCVKFLIWRRNDSHNIYLRILSLWHIEQTYIFSPGRIDGKNIFPLLAVPSVPSCFRLTVAFYYLSMSFLHCWHRSRHFGTKTVQHKSEMTARHFGTKKIWCRSVRTLRHQLFGAELSWCRSVLVPKCPDTIETSLEIVLVMFTRFLKKWNKQCIDEDVK